MELGAHYIHGTVGNPVYDFAVEKGIVGEAEEPLGKPLSVLNNLLIMIIDSFSTIFYFS